MVAEREWDARKFSFFWLVWDSYQDKRNEPTMFRFRIRGMREEVGGSRRKGEEVVRLV